MDRPDAAPCSGLYVWKMGRKEGLPESRDRKGTLTGRHNWGQVWKPNSARQYPVFISLQGHVGDLRKVAELQEKMKTMDAKVTGVKTTPISGRSVFPWIGCILTPTLLYPQELQTVRRVRSWFLRATRIRQTTEAPSRTIRTITNSPTRTTTGEEKKASEPAG